MTQDAQDQARPFIVTARDEHSATITLGRGRGYTPSASSTAAQNDALDRQTQQNLASTQTLFAGGKPYPEMPKISATKPLVRSLGATGTAILGGIITSEEYNEDFYWKDGVRIYEQMLRSEGQIAALRSSIELPIRRTTWSIEPGSQDERDLEIASFVETCLFHELRYTTSEGRVLTQKWDDVLRHALMCLWYGFMPFEQVWRLDDGWVKWARFIPLLPRTVWRWWVGEDNELVGIQQWTFKDYGYQFTDIPADKLLLFVHRQEGNNYEGVSLLRQAYQHWWYKQQLYKIEAIGIEHNAISIPVITLPENFTPNDVAAANTQLANLRANESMGVVKPPGWGFEYAPNYQKHAMEIQPTIQHHDVLIARSALAQFLNLGSTETGAFALADVQTKTFLESLQAVCEYIEDVFNNDAIRRLVDYNFVDVESYPRLKAGKVALTDIKDIASSLASLVNIPTPLIHPDPELEDYLRDVLGLPKAPVGVVQGTDPSAPDSGAQPENENGDETSDEGAAGENDSANGGNDSNQQSQPPDNTEDPGEDDQSGGGGSGDGGSGASMSEARLLREAFAAVAGFDAVARAERFRFGPGYNPYRDNHGKFAPGPHAARPGEGEGHGGGGGAPKAPKGRGRAGGGGNANAANKAPAKAKVDEAAVANAKAKGHQEFEQEHAAAVAKRQGATGTGQHKAQQESIHEKSARLQREQGLRAEANPHTMARDQHGMLKLEQRADIVRDPTHIIDVSRGVNPHQLVRVYGEHQLGAALSQHSASELKDTAESLGLKAGRSKAETVSRITAHVTEGRYSANFAGEARSQRAAKGEAAAKREDAAKRDASTRPASRATRANPEPSQLTPVMHLPGRIINPALSLDPHFVRAAFGDHQLHAALAQHSHSVLRDAAQNLGVRPGRERETTIQRLMSRVQQAPMETLQSHYRAHPNTPYSSIRQSGEA